MKTKLSKIISAWLLSLLLVFSTAACSSNEPASPVDSVDMQSTLAIDVGEEATLQVALTPVGVEVPNTWK